MDLSNLNRLDGIQRGKKRVGRGIGSGKGGHTTGKGNKGQKARSGNRKPWLGFEGGQVPLYKRLPQMRGFKVHGKVRPLVLNLRDLNVFEDGTELTPQVLLEKGKIDRLNKAGVKLLGNGELEKKLSLKGFTYSESAKKKIEQSGSKILQ